MSAPYALAAAIVCLLLSVCSCGKKGNPTLASYEKPDPPSSLTAIHREDVVILRWGYSRSTESAITDFIVLRAEGSGFEKISLVEKEKRIFEDKNIKTGQQYRYKIISRNFRGVYSDSSNIVTVTPLAVPAAPVNLVYRIAGDVVSISWEGGQEGGLFNIYKTAERGVYGLTPVNREPLSEPFFQDRFDVNKTVYYTLRSLTGGDVRDEGPASEELAVNPLDLVPSRPEGLEFLAAQDGVYLYWKESPESWVTGFRVYRKSGTEDYVLIGETQIPTFIDREAPSSKRDYRVAAVGPAREGPPAEIKDIMHSPQR